MAHLGEKPPLAALAERLRREGLVIASHNPGKVREIADLLAPFGIAVVSAGELGLEEPEETGRTFAENARIKAEAAARASGRPALSDDSGLAVRALNGAPGIHSARWAGPERDFDKAMERVWKALSETADPDRRAAFICVLALALPEGDCHLFEGRVDGQIVWPPRGNKGFGYDPIFVPEGHDLTFGEMEPAAKHAISHRADAFARMVAALFGSR
ncbi:MAG: RdgB/HAM1 family non-canonical purine NTP pyrophosphatase [Alphaproteobacteria bacterium]|nr:MAG: RdgB/HAM1 family non-canonical purine NTP pyrophosphatase [Alphaproteobacteria bacterium]